MSGPVSRPDAPELPPGLVRISQDTVLIPPESRSRCQEYSLQSVPSECYRPPSPQSNTNHAYHHPIPSTSKDCFPSSSHGTRMSHKEAHLLFSDSSLKECSSSNAVPYPSNFDLLESAESVFQDEPPSVDHMYLDVIRDDYQTMLSR